MSITSDDDFEFDIDAQLEDAQERAREKALTLPSSEEDEGECESCKI
ncbi:MAG: hypothetical protein XXXJIFNMEKO3_01704 [Candidatus Erwinia impunctatus]|nr:hypothetical protein XXXJIFNMEKO_01704 [Culicoides impunctatus]